MKMVIGLDYSHCEAIGVVAVNVVLLDHQEKKEKQNGKE